VTSRDPFDSAWWLASRSAGIVAYLLLSAVVLAGLAMALRLGSTGVRRSLRAVHEQLALLALGATAAHGLVLLGDPWLKPGLSGLLVPFASSYRPFWTGLGVLTFAGPTQRHASSGRREHRLALGDGGDEPPLVIHQVRLHHDLAAPAVQRPW
jgi:hypothetical protein